MNEAKVQEICKAADLSGYTHEELQECDQWVKDYALNKFAEYISTKGLDNSMREYVTLMVRCHYESVETDEFLRAYKCYPEWL